MEINHKKLAQVVVNLRGKMNQREFARYISKTYGYQISYTTISKLEMPLSKKKTNNYEPHNPALETVEILAKLSGVTPGEFLDFIQAPDDVPLSASKSYQESKLDLSQSPDRFLELFKMFNSDIKLHVFEVISDQMIAEAREAFKLKSVIQSLKSLEN